MQYVCDAPKGKTWFRIETEGEAAHESRLMSHAVEKYFRRLIGEGKTVAKWVLKMDSNKKPRTMPGLLFAERRRKA